MSDHSTTLAAPPQVHEHAEGHHGPKNPVRVYSLTLACLLFLTFLTVLIAQFDLGEANVFAAIGVATIKATIVALFFMHLLHDKLMNSVVLCTALVMLGLLLAFSFMDSTTRDDMVPNGGVAPAGSNFNRPKNLAVPYEGKKPVAPGQKAPAEHN
jgi:cytochrome c oxidase subunit IV